MIHVFPVKLGIMVKIFGVRSSMSLFVFNT